MAGVQLSGEPALVVFRSAVAWVERLLHGRHHPQESDGLRDAQHAVKERGQCGQGERDAGGLASPLRSQQHGQPRGVEAVDAEQVQHQVTAAALGEQRLNARRTPGTVSKATTSGIRATVTPLWRS